MKLQAEIGHRGQGQGRGGSNRQSEPEGAARFPGAFHTNSAAVSFHGELAKGQAQTGAAPTAITFDLDEFIKYFLAEFRGNTRSGIPHCDPDVIGADQQRQLDNPIRRRKLKRIIQQVLQHAVNDPVVEEEGNLRRTICYFNFNVTR